jgi:hypothetical protein
MQIRPSGSMVRSSDVMRLLQNCAEMKMSALLLDSHICLVKKMTGLMAHFRGAPEHRITARDLVGDLDESDPAGEQYIMVRPVCKSEFVLIGV